jgi:hypothetical protein
VYAQDRFLRQLFERTGGQTNQTVHAVLHLARPLALSTTETDASIAALSRAGLIGVDPMFGRLIWLTPAGAAACTRSTATDAVIKTGPLPRIAPSHDFASRHAPVYHTTEITADR